jgi:drug/metabolite transporter (DMT)-like permease
LSVAALLAGATMWGTVWYPMRLLEAAGIAGIWLTFSLYVAATLAGVVLTWRDLGWFLRRPGLLAALGLSAGWTNLAFVLAILDGNVVRVLLLFYLSPVWATVLGALVLREPIHKSTILVLMVALAGAGMMLWRPGSDLPLPARASDWLALSSGFAFAVSNLFVRQGVDVPVRIKSMSAWVGVVVLAAALAMLRHAPQPTLTMSLGLGIVAVAWLGIVVMTMLVQYGVTRMPVHRSAVILLFELVAGTISQQLLTAETLRPLEWGGGVLVVLAAVLAAVRQRKDAQALA